MVHMNVCCLMAVRHPEDFFHVSMVTSYARAFDGGNRPCCNCFFIALNVKVLCMPNQVSKSVSQGLKI